MTKLTPTLYSLIKSLPPGTTVVILADQKLISHYAAKLHIKCTTQTVMVIEDYTSNPITVRGTKVTRE